MTYSYNNIIGTVDKKEGSIIVSRQYTKILFEVDTGQKMGFLTIGNVTERWVAADITGNNPSYRIHDISQCMSGRG